MIIINHSSLQCSGCCHFGRFDYNARAYAADADFENLDYFSEEEQIYYTVSNNNSSENFDSEEDNSTINFALSKPFQCRYKY